MKKILLGATAALLMTGCAQNELLDGGISTPNDGKIYFSATSGVPTNTRAANGNPINSTADLQGRPGAWGTFHVQGYVDGTGAAYVNADPTFNGASWEYKNEPYWPNASMDFYAYANWATAPAIDPTTGITATDVTIAADQLNDNGQKDLLVAGTFNANKEVRTLLTFKHALTQIVFKAGNINPSKITAKIGGVKIVNVGSMGNMAFKKDAPAVKWSKPTTIGAATAIEPNGAAAAPADRRASYEVKGIGATVPTGFLAPDLSATPNDYSKYPRIQTAVETDNNALMLLPQNFNAWNTNDGKKVDAADEFGAYIELEALVYEAGLNPVGTAADINKYVYAGSSNGTAFSYGKIYIPVSSLENEAGQWVPGKRINYIITFGDSNSGSGGAGYDENGDPILVPIRFRAVVEDWVETDVPLLTATFEASSSNITHKFIDGYTNQLLNDIKAATAPKVYSAEIKLKGTLSANIGTGSDFVNSNITNGTGTAVLPVAANVNFQSLLTGADSFTFLNAKFRPGSTLVYDFQGVSNLSQANKAIIEIPNGWYGQSMTGVNVNPAILAAGVTITLDATTTGVKLTKIATNAHTLYATWVNETKGYSYQCQAGYIEDNLAAVELNENYAATPNKFTNTITVSNPMPSTPNAYFFSSDMLAKFENTAFDNSTVTINMSTVTIPSVTVTANLRSIQTVVPKGWTINKNGTIYYPGDLVAIHGASTEASNTVAASDVAEFTWTYTKQLGTPGAHGNWKNELELAYWLTQTKTTGVNDVFYYDNTDGLITLDLTPTSLVYPSTTTKWADMVGNGTIYFKNNVGAVKVTGNVGTGTWTWTNEDRKLTYNATVGTQTNINITYLTKAALLSTAASTGTYYVTAAAPENFGTATDWEVTSAINNTEKFTVYFSDAAPIGGVTDGGGWVFTAATNSAEYTSSRTVLSLAGLNTAIATAANNATFIAASTANNLSTVDATANATLVKGNTVAVTVLGKSTITLPSAYWTLAGRVATYTKP